MKKKLNNKNVFRWIAKVSIFQDTFQVLNSNHYIKIQQGKHVDVKKYLTFW